MYNLQEDQQMEGTENPNRLQHYYQYQVIIKPSPDNIKQTYLKVYLQLVLMLKIMTYVLLKMIGKVQH